jgi:hypothetical protein
MHARSTDPTRWRHWQTEGAAARAAHSIEAVASRYSSVELERQHAVDAGRDGDTAQRDTEIDLRGKVRRPLDGATGALILFSQRRVSFDLEK